jgi:hypothetical protein
VSLRGVQRFPKSLSWRTQDAANGRVFLLELGDGSIHKVAGATTRPHPQLAAEEVETIAKVCPSERLKCIHFVMTIEGAKFCVPQ